METNEVMTSVLWRRLGYMLSPQLDLYQNIAPKVDGLKVMEVGFGTGMGTLQLARLAKIVVAIEPDGQAVRFAEKVLPIRNIVWVEADITRLKAKERFDAVVMVETLEHIQDWQKALRTIHGFLKPEGKLYMTARNRNADLRRNDLHEREWSSQELSYNLGQYFKNVELFDYTLENGLGVDTHITPLIATATK